MPGNVEWAGYDALMKRLGGMAKVTFADAIPLLEEGERILIEGNRRKVLGSKQGDGSPMPPVTYRTGIGKATQARKGRNFGIPKFAAKGRTLGNKQGDPHANGNLTTAEYKRLTGPPLAPRGERSRIIANLETAIGQANGRFYASKVWREILDRKGREFMTAHFTGKARGGKKRDMRGVDAKEVEQFRAAVRRWARWLLNGKVD